MKKRRKISVKAGMPPGTIVHIGDKLTEKSQLHIVNYDPSGLREKVIHSPDDVKPFLEMPGTITWFDCIGVSHLTTIEKIGQIFNIHPLVLEDVVNTEQRPKLEDYKDYDYFSLRYIEMKEATGEFDYCQVSIIFGSNFVLTFQEEDKSLFNDIKRRIQNGASRALSRPSDFLVYLLVDTIVDTYFDLSEKLNDRLEDIEDLILTDFRGAAMRDLQNLRRNMALLLKSLYPLREAISRVEKRDNPFLHPETILYFRDVYDHIVHIIESIENQRDILSGTMDIYLTSQNNRMNSVMKVLTIIATIFMPLSFLASIYGMNFHYFPELGWKYGYLFFWVLCAVLFIVMLIFFKRKKWLE